MLCDVDIHFPSEVLHLVAKPADLEELLTAFEAPDKKFHIHYTVDGGGLSIPVNRIVFITWCEHLGGDTDEMGQ